MLWKVSSSNGAEGYLAGSIHLVKSNFYPLDPVFEKIFKKSDCLVLETNDGNIVQSMISSALYQNGDKLINHLPSDLFAKTKERLTKIGFENYNYLKPWFAATVIMNEESIENPNIKKGIGGFFREKAKKEGKTIYGLETTKQQLQIFSDLKGEQQVEFLRFALEKPNKNTQFNEKFTKYWKNGNVRAAHNLLNDKKFHHLGNFSKELNQALIIGRNENWLKQLENIFKKEKVPFIVVGLGHLVGNHNLIGLLKKDGYTVQQM